MSGKPDRYSVSFQKFRHLLPVVQCTHGAVQSGLIEEIVVGHRDHLRVLFFRLLQDLFHPEKGLTPDPAFHKSLRLIDGGIQHQEPVSVVCLVEITERGRVRGGSLVVTEAVPYLQKRIPVHGRLRGFLPVPVVGSSPHRDSDIVVSRNHQHSDAIVLEPLQFFRKFPVIDGLAVHHKIPAQDHSPRPFLKDLVDPSVHDLVNILQILPVVPVEAFPECRPEVRHFRRDVVRVGGDPDQILVRGRGSLWFFLHRLLIPPGPGTVCILPFFLFQGLPGAKGFLLPGAVMFFRDTVRRRRLGCCGFLLYLRSRNRRRGLLSPVLRYRIQKKRASCDKDRSHGPDKPFFKQ